VYPGNHGAYIGMSWVEMGTKRGETAEEVDCACAGREEGDVADVEMSKDGFCCCFTGGEALGVRCWGVEAEARAGCGG